MRGISTNQNVLNYAQALQQNGIDFVFRYYSNVNAAKCLKRAEGEALGDLGIQVAVVYEDGPTSLAYFSSTRGHRDAVNAYFQGVQLHQPPGSAIYFAIDYDAKLADISGAILDYFRGVERGMSDAGNGSSLYSIGVYGSGAACGFIKAHCPAVTLTWLAESTGWKGSRDYQGWDVKQSIASAPLAGLQPSQYEDCESNSEDFGAFLLTSLT